MHNTVRTTDANFEKQQTLIFHQSGGSHSGIFGLLCTSAIQCQQWHLQSCHLQTQILNHYKSTSLVVSFMATLALHFDCYSPKFVHPHQSACYENTTAQRINFHTSSLNSLFMLFRLLNRGSSALKLSRSRATSYSQLCFESHYVLPLVLSCVVCYCH